MKFAADRVEAPEIIEVARRAQAASRMLAALPDECRREALVVAAESLVERNGEILAANALDIDAATGEFAAGRMTRALIDRLAISERGVIEMAGRVREVARLADPLGRVLLAMELDDGLTLYKRSCPLGVIGIIFESRPDIIPQVASLALRSGNAVIFKGGSEAASTNQTIASIWRDALRRFPEIPTDAIHLVRTRADVAALLDLDNFIDLIIPRGSRDFVRYVASNTRIPVMSHGEGICHVFVDCAADVEKALAIAFDSKVQYPAACNSMETLLVHADIAASFLPEIATQFNAAGVEMRGCPRTIATIQAPIQAASETDWATEYSDLIVSIKVVSSASEAIEHIQRYGSRHTESIVTEDLELAKRFIFVIDAASVVHNASTRFDDGYRFGLGAEIGISTSKLHARGPVGLDALTTYKYELYGSGHTVAPYSLGERSFKHRALPID